MRARGGSGMKRNEFVIEDHATKLVSPVELVAGVSIRENGNRGGTTQHAR